MTDALTQEQRDGVRLLLEAIDEGYALNLGPNSASLLGLHVADLQRQLQEVTKQRDLLAGEEERQNAEIVELHRQLQEANDDLRAEKAVVEHCTRSAIGWQRLFTEWQAKYVTAERERDEARADFKAQEALFFADNADRRNEFLQRTDDLERQLQEANERYERERIIVWQSRDAARDRAKAAEARADAAEQQLQEANERAATLEEALAAYIQSHDDRNVSECDCSICYKVPPPTGDEGR